MPLDHSRQLVFRCLALHPFHAIFPQSIEESMRVVASSYTPRGMHLAGDEKGSLAPRMNKAGLISSGLMKEYGELVDWCTGARKVYEGGGTIGPSLTAAFVGRGAVRESSAPSAA